MKEKLSESEKELINVTLTYLKEYSSFANKVLFTIVSLAAGGLYVLLQEDIEWNNSTVDLVIIAIILGIMLFSLNIIIQRSYLRSRYSTLLEGIKLEKIADFHIGRTSNIILFVESLQFGIFTYIISLVLSENNTIAFITYVVTIIIFFVAFKKWRH